MDSRYATTQAALDHFDAVDHPAVETLQRRDGIAANFSRFVDARRAAADRVRAAYLHETEAFISEENVDLMSVEEIRESLKLTPLGRILKLLP